MRIIGKINKIEKDKVEFIPVDIFPQEIRYFKKIKNKKIYIEKEENLVEGKFVALDENKSKEIVYKNFKIKNKKLYFSRERGKYYIPLENEFLRVLINPEKGGKIESLLNKKNNFEWLFDDFTFDGGKLSRCGISQGFKERSLYEKKLNYRWSKNEFFGKRKERDFSFEKRIKILNKKLFISFSLKSKKENKFYPFFEIRFFTDGKPYEYSIKYKEDGNIKEMPLFSYPVFSGWRYIAELGIIKEIVIENNKNKIKIKPEIKNLVNSDFGYGIDYFYFRFFYKKFNKNFDAKILISC